MDVSRGFAARRIVSERNEARWLIFLFLFQNYVQLYQKGRNDNYLRQGWQGAQEERQKGAQGEAEARPYQHDDRGGPAARRSPTLAQTPRQAEGKGETPVGHNRRLHRLVPREPGPQREPQLLAERLEGRRAHPERQLRGLAQLPQQPAEEPAASAAAAAETRHPQRPEGLHNEGDRRGGRGERRERRFEQPHQEHAQERGDRVPEPAERLERRRGREPLDEPPGHNLDLAQRRLADGHDDELQLRHAPLQPLPRRGVAGLPQVVEVYELRREPAAAADRAARAAEAEDADDPAAAGAEERLRVQPEAGDDRREERRRGAGAERADEGRHLRGTWCYSATL